MSCLFAYFFGKIVSNIITLYSKDGNSCRMCSEKRYVESRREEMRPKNDLMQLFRCCKLLMQHIDETSRNFPGVHF